MQHFQQTIPVLAFLNIAKTFNFYRDKLGFDKIGSNDANYAVVGRDKIEIHFWECNNRIHPERTSCYIHVTDVEALYTEMHSARNGFSMGSSPKRVIKKSARGHA